MKPIFTRTVKGVVGLFLFLIPLISMSQSDLCSAAPTLVSGPTCSTTAGSITAGATYTAILPSVGCGVAFDDVWYTFIAKSTNPTITLPTNTITNPRLQILSGNCVTMNSIACVSGTTLAPTGLTIGTQYWIRISSNANNVAGTFTICITDPAPANDLCAGAIPLTPGLSCTNTTGNFYASTVTGSPATTPCTGPATYDMWYTFTAVTDNAVIALSNLGSSVTGARLQVFSGTCAGLTSIGCGDDSLSIASLVPGTTYFIRAYGTNTAPTAPTNADFRICVTYSLPPAPVNDECVDAITLPVSTGCNKVWGTIQGATASATAITPCTGPATYDVWYKFVAVSTTTTVAFADFGANFPPTGQRRMQLLSGSCGSLVPVTPAASGCTNSYPWALTGLTIGATYYIRIYSNTGSAAPITGGEFSICLTNATIPPRYGNSYVNLTKKKIGGVVEKGDTLEIRMSVSHTSGTLFRPRYFENVPTNTTMLVTAADSIRVISNEGMTYRKYTVNPGVNDDAATYLASPPVGEYNVRMNLGLGTTPPAAPGNNSISDLTGTFIGATVAQIATTNNPKGGGGSLFATSFRVKVTGNPGDTIKFGTGQFIYRTSAAGGDVALSTTPFQILISDPQTLCANSVGMNSAEEFGGTFGLGGTLNRGSDLTSPIPGYTFVTVSSSQAVGDGQYAIVKNVSPVNSTNPTANKQPTCGAPPAVQACSNRMFNGFWDITGDHSGTVNAAGNLPPAASDTSGYMLEVNADYVASEVYRQTLSGLCPDTYYEFSAWVKNICTNCGIDTAGASTYKPGVLPNLTFIIDGVDRYNTGEVDTTGGWTKKGFVFLNGSAPSITFAIRNNSQGGGGNDWVIDDIKVATCLPQMIYSPSNNPVVCRLNARNVYDTVRSFFNNYRYYKWQRSTDGGTTWSDVTATLGPSTPVKVNGMWEYYTYYTIPPAQADLPNNGDMYRVVAATSPGNLSSTNCIFTDGVATVTLSVLACGTPLKTDLLSFNGKLVNNYANLTWTTSKEDEDIKYHIERSTDGSNFQYIGAVNAFNNNSAFNQYNFIDPVPVTGKVYYRIVMINAAANGKYSRIVPLSVDDKNIFGFGTVVNPFGQTLDFNIHSPSDRKVDAELLDMFGKTVKRKSFIIHTGVNSLSMADTDQLPAGTYILRVRGTDNEILSTKVVKKNLY